VKKALVTGASGTIGFAIAAKLQKLGYEVHACGRNKDNLKRLKGCELHVLDFLENDYDFLNYFDIIVNNAGRYEYCPIEKRGDLALLTLNTVVPYKLCSLNVPRMKKNNWGRIVNIGSISAVVGEANASLYALSKSALLGMTKSLALELAQNGITVNTINPGWVKTDLAENSIENSDFSEDEILETIPQKRYIEPAEIADLTAFLISNEAKGITGQCINLCAGLSCG